MPSGAVDGDPLVDQRSRRRRRRADLDDLGEGVERCGEPGLVVGMDLDHRVADAQQQRALLPHCRSDARSMPALLPHSRSAMSSGVEGHVHVDIDELAEPPTLALVVGDRKSSYSKSSYIHSLHKTFYEAIRV